jgi:transcriptional regulator with XRE-family HTH domain
MQPTHLGEKLKQAMNRSSLSRKEIANKAGISEAGLYKLIRAKDIKAGTLMKLVDVLDLTWESFFNSKIDSKLEEIKQSIIRIMAENESLRARNKILEQQQDIVEEYLKALEQRSPGSGTFLRLITTAGIQNISLSTFQSIMRGLFSAMHSYPRRTDRIIRYLGRAINILEYRKYLWRNIYLFEPDIEKSLHKLIRKTGPEEFINDEKIRKAIAI